MSQLCHSHRRQPLPLQQLRQSSPADRQVRAHRCFLRAPFHDRFSYAASHPDFLVLVAAGNDGSLATDKTASSSLRVNVSLLTVCFVDWRTRYLQELFGCWCFPNQCRPSCSRCQLCQSECYLFNESVSRAFLLHHQQMQRRRLLQRRF